MTLNEKAALKTDNPFTKDEVKTLFVSTEHYDVWRSLLAHVDVIAENAIDARNPKNEKQVRFVTKTYKLLKQLLDIEAEAGVKPPVDEIKTYKTAGLIG